VIRIDQLGLFFARADLRGGAQRLMSCVAQSTCTARDRHGDLLANPLAKRVKLLVPDGLGMWRAARSLNTGHVARPSNWPTGPLAP
jgi:transposase